MNTNKIKRLSVFAITILLLSICNIAFANNDYQFKKVDYTDSYKKWLELSDEEKAKQIQPRMYDIVPAKNNLKNPLLKANLFAENVDSSYTLQGKIPMSLKSQQQTSTCWTFAAISSLETNLALFNQKRYGSTTEYDFSERHMEYSTSRDAFINNQFNYLGYNRELDSGGNFINAESYFTNGSGAIPESEMPFENNSNKIDISQIQEKPVSSQVYDTINFIDYNVYPSEKSETIAKVKQHIKSYGSVFASIHTAGIATQSLGCYNNSTNSLYCNDKTNHAPDHAVSIIGWDDNYSIDKFSTQPQSAGAWIVRNSWGDGDTPPGYFHVSYEDCNISSNLYGIIKATDYINYENIYQHNILSPNLKLTLTTNTATFCNVFTKKTSGLEYLTQVSINTPQTYTAKVYVNPNNASKNESDLQPVKLRAGESETFNIGYHSLEFAEPIEIKGDQFAVVVEVEAPNLEFCIEAPDEDLNKYVSIEENKSFLKLPTYDTWIDMGNSEAMLGYPGYNTIKAFTTSKNDNFLDSIEKVSAPTKTQYYEGDSFDASGMTVVAHYKDGDSYTITDYEILNGTNLAIGQNTVTINYNGKSFNQEITVLEKNIADIKLSTVPAKLEYIQNIDNLDLNGGIITISYNNGASDNVNLPSNLITVSGFDNSTLGKKTITLTYNYKNQQYNVSYDINIVENSLVSLSIASKPNKTSYIVGEDFNATGMKLEATYKSGMTQEITDYEIINGTNLALNQTLVEIYYNGLMVEQQITVNAKEEPNDEPIDEPNDNPIDEPNDNPVDDPNDNPIDEPNDNPIDKPNDNPVDKPIKTPVSSSFNNANCKVTNIKYYYDTQSYSNDYFIFNVVVDNISRYKEKNDSYKYYYYLSSRKNENNITNWIEIADVQTSNDKLEFKINSKDIKNYYELSSLADLYLYIKEVAITGNNKATMLSSAMYMELSNDAEFYINDSNINRYNSDNIVNTDNSKTDNTTSTSILPYTGTVTLLILIAIISSISIFAYIKYRKLNKYIK